jgi:hypothetical protein
MPSQRSKPKHTASDDNDLAHQINGILQPRSIPKKKD